ncbi:MAG: acylneuraminate cytidylyltransferase family protein [Patescibacteria group bacterium]
MKKNPKNPRTLGIIPARGGSKSIPKKNIVTLCGKPLIFYTIRGAEESKLLDAYIVSTDSPEIKSVAEEHGADVPFLRPAEFSADKSVDIEFLKHALLWVKEHRGWTPDIVINLRPTAPLRTAEDIDAIIELMDRTGCDSVKAVIVPKQNPFKMWRVNEHDQSMQPLLPTEHFDKLGTDVPRQLLPQNVFWQSGVIDATRARFILEQNKVFGSDMRGLVLPEEKSIDLDEPSDLIFAEFMMKRLGLDK